MNKRSQTQSRHSTNSLKYALSLRYYSPRVEMHYQFSRKFLESSPKVDERCTRAVIRVLEAIRTVSLSRAFVVNTFDRLAPCG